MSAAKDKAFEAIRLFMTNEHGDLGDFIYNVREHEMQGWEGPAVRQWSDAVRLAKEAMVLGEEEGLL